MVVLLTFAPSLFIIVLAMRFIISHSAVIILTSSSLLC